MEIETTLPDSLFLKIMRISEAIYNDGVDHAVILARFISSEAEKPEYYRVIDDGKYGRINISIKSKIKIGDDVRVSKLT